MESAQIKTARQVKTTGQANGVAALISLSQEPPPAKKVKYQAKIRVFYNYSMGLEVVNRKTQINC
jgi:hypothetical protein